MSLVPPDPELDPIEAALGSMTPARSRLDRDRLMFQAGVNSVEARSARRWVWPVVAASLAVVSLSESVVLATRPAAGIVVVHEPASPANDSGARPAPVEILVEAPERQLPVLEEWSSARGEMLALRQQVLRFGLDGLPDPPPLLSQAEGPASASGSTPESGGPLRRFELNKVLDLGGPS